MCTCLRRNGLLLARERHRHMQVSYGLVGDVATVQSRVEKGFALTIVVSTFDVPARIIALGKYMLVFRLRLYYGTLS